MKTILLLMMIFSASFGAQYSVIISKKTNVATLSTQQIRDIFLQKRHFLGSQQIIPINLLGHEASRMAFEATVLDMDREHLNMYWVKQHYQGVTPPITQPSHESIKAFVQNVDGAIGYLPSSMVDNTVRVIYEF